MNMECQRRTSVFGARISTVSSLGQWKQRSDSKICTNMLGNPVLSVLCVEPIMEIWILIRSLSHWHLIHPFVAWYNLTSAWHFVGKILTNCFHESVNVPAFYQNHSWEQIMWVGQRWHWRLWQGLRLTTFNFSFHRRPLQGSLTQPNCDKDQLYSRPGLWFNTKCYIRCSSACKRWPFKQEEKRVLTKILTFRFESFPQRLDCFTAVSECHPVVTHFIEIVLRTVWSGTRQNQHCNDLLLFDSQP